MNSIILCGRSSFVSRFQKIAGGELSSVRATIFPEEVK